MTKLIILLLTLLFIPTTHSQTLIFTLLPGLPPCDHIYHQLYILDKPLSYNISDPNFIAPIGSWLLYGGSHISDDTSSRKYQNSDDVWLTTNQGQSWVFLDNTVFPKLYIWVYCPDPQFSDISFFRGWFPDPHLGYI